MSRILCALIFLLITNSSCFAATKETGTFSDLKFNEESGDLSGTEIRIILGRSGKFATIQISEGGAMDPILLPLTIENSEYVFQIPKNHMYESKYKFKVQPDGLTGTTTLPNGSVKKISLKRTKSYWD